MRNLKALLQALEDQEARLYLNEDQAWVMPVQDAGHSQRGFRVKYCVRFGLKTALNAVDRGLVVRDEEVTRRFKSHESIPAPRNELLGNRVGVYKGIPF